MRIAQVAPLYERVPPRLYGGTERVVSWLTEELVRRGHEVTLFATADSETSATLVPCAPHALRIGSRLLDGTPWHMAMVERVAASAHAFDVVHFHIDQLHLPTARRMKTPSLTTLHGRLDLPGVAQLYELFSDAPLVSISNAQRAGLPAARWLSTVHHGLPMAQIEEGDGSGDHFVFLGRFAREKGAEQAIEIARRAGVPLKLAAKLGDENREYFESAIRPLLGGGGAEVVGEVGEPEKGPLVGGARALLFPIDWPEPFGLVMIEALARGTPVIAFPRGSVPEVIDHGVTGFIVDGVDAAVEAVRRVHHLDRRRIRAVARRRFSVETMTSAYLRLYRELATDHRRPRIVRAALG